MPAGREARLGAAGERGGCAAAVGLVSDDDDDVATAGGCVAHVVRCRAGGQALVNLGDAEPERGRGLKGTQERARDDGVRLDPLSAQARAERMGLRASRGCERAKLVGVAGCGFGVANDQELHRGQDNQAMTKLGGTAGTVAAFVLTAGLAFDGGGFAPVSFDRALVGLAALALVVVLLFGGARPGRLGGLLLAGLGLLAAWTAASWFWSDSPPAALVEAQRVALYAVAAASVVLAGRRVPPARLGAGIFAGATTAAVWNLAVRLAPDWSGRAPVRVDIGQLADPVGYANGLALLAALGVVLALGLDGVAAVALVPLAATIALQQSAGTDAALAAALVVYVLTAARPLRVLALVVLPAAAAIVVAHSSVVVDPPPTNLLAAAHQGHRLLAVLVVLTLAEAAVVVGAASLPAGRRVSPRVARFAIAAVAVAALVAAPTAFRGHERGHYWTVATHEVRADPVLGSGAGTFVDWWLRLRTVPQSTEEAHSLYLETLAELGSLGLALLLVALVAPLLAAWRLRDDRYGPPLLAVLVLYDLAAAVDFHWELPAATMPAILLAASAVVWADGGRPEVPRRYAVPALAAVGAAGALALAGNAALSAGDAQRALRFAPYSADAWQMLGTSRQAAGDVAGARAAYRHAVRLDPNDWTAWLALAGVSRGEPRRFASAEAARLNPLANGS